MGKESILSEVLSASIGGSFSASALYPLEVLKTKMQAESKASAADSEERSDVDNIDNVDSDSEVGVDANGDVVSADEVVDADEDSDVDFTLTKSTTKPSIKSKSMSKPTNEPKSAIAYAQTLYETEGITPFYQGISTSAFQSATEKALYFFAYTFLKNIHHGITQTDEMGTSMNLILGCMAEWAHLPITLPLDCWTTKIQTDKSCSNMAPMAVLMTMLRDKNGIQGMYKGWQAYTVLCLKPSIQYTVFEQVKKIMLLRKRLSRSKSQSSTSAVVLEEEALTASEAFILGMISRTIATMVVFPYLRAKVMLQGSSSSASSTSASGSPTSIPGMIAQMYSSGGLGEVFQGIGPELTRGVLSTALMMMVKEKLSYAVRKTLRE